MKTKHYNQKQGTLKHYKNENKEQSKEKHYKNENKTLQSKTRNTKTLQE